MLWSRLGYLGPFVWARGDRFDRVDEGEVVQTDLGRALDGLSLAHVVGVGMPDDSNRVGRDLIVRVRAAQKIVARALPGLQPPTPALLMCPRDEATEIERPPDAELLNVLTIVVPEDVADPGAANYLTEPDDEAFVSHVAHAVACLCGIWGGENESTVGEAASDTGPQARLVRCHTRLIDAGYLADHLAAYAFVASSDGWPNPEPTEFERGVVEADALERLAERYVGAHASVLGRAPLPTDEGPEALSLWAALKKICSYILSRLIRWPIEWLLNKVAWFWNTKLAPFVERLAPRSGVRVKRFGDRTKTKIPEPERPVRMQDGAIGPAWRELVMLATGLIDGHALPSFVDEEWLAIGERRLLAADPQQVAPDPELRPPLTQPYEGVYVCDPRTLDALVEAEWRVLVQTAAQLAEVLVLALQSGDGESEESAAVSDDDVRALVAALEMLHLRLCALLEWHATVSSSLLWRIGRLLQQEIEDVILESQPPTEDEWAQADETDEVAKASHPKRRLRLLVRSVVLGLLVAWGADGPFLPALSRPFIVVGAFSLWWLLGFRSWWKKHIAETREERTAREYRASLELRQKYAGTRAYDHARLERRYEEFCDWADVASRFLHRPWTERRVVYEPPDAQLREKKEPRLPQAARVAYASLDRRDVALLAAAAQSTVFEPAWLTSHFTDWLDRVCAEWQRHRPTEGVVAGAGVHAFADASRDPDSLRTFTVDVARQGSLRSVEESEAVRGFFDSIGRRPFASTIPFVVDHEDADEPPLPPMPDWFESPTGLTQLAEQVKRTVVGVAIRTSEGSGWGTGVVVSPEGVVATNRHVVEDALALHVVLGDGSRHAARTEEIAPHGDLALIRFDPPGNLLAAPPAKAPNLVQGTPVFTLGYPFFSTESGEPSLSWGIVAARRRRLEAGSGMYPGDYVQLNYPAGGGASGSPIFNLAGELIAIHAGGSTQATDDARGRYISFAAPVEDLWPLLEDVQPSEITRAALVDEEYSERRVPIWDYTKSLAGLSHPCQFGPYGELTLEARAAAETTLMPQALARAATAASFSTLSSSEFIGRVCVGEPTRAYLTRVDRSAPFVLEDAAPGWQLPWFVDQADSTDTRAGAHHGHAGDGLGGL